MANERFSQLLDAQQALIEKIALGARLNECLHSICELIESTIESPDAKSSILLLEGNRLHHGAAPSIDPEYCHLTDGVVIGPTVGSCGAAVTTKKQIIVSDIATDPLWHDFKDLAFKYGLQACWSTPIFSSNQTVLGSFAVYYPTPRTPSRNDLDLISRFSHISSLAIEKNQSEKREKKLSSELALAHEKLKALTSVMPDLGLVISEEGFYVDIYGADHSLLVNASEEMVGKHVNQGVREAMAELVAKTIGNVLATDQVQIVEYPLDVAKGSRVFEGRVTAIKNYLPGHPEKRHVLWMARDITERKQAEQQIELLAYYDALTELPNRRLLQDHLKQSIAKQSRYGTFGALLYLDLDNFKDINDSLGHSVGDIALKKVVERIRESLRETDLFARLAGDEFVVLLESSSDDSMSMLQDATRVAVKVLKSLQPGFKLDGAEKWIRASIGIALIDGRNTTIDSVLKEADRAMYKAKALDGNCIICPPDYTHKDIFS